MGRKAEPWLRKQNQTWYVERDGKQVNLGKDKDEAHRKFHEMLGKRPDEPRPVLASELTAKELLHTFLEWTEKHRAAETLRWYTIHLKAFLKSLSDGETREAMEVRPIDVIRWVDAQKKWSPTYKRGAMIAVQRAFNWGAKTGLLEKTPITYLEKPAPERREDYMTEADYTAILGKIRDEQFKDLVTFCWECGSRPQEARQLTAAMFEPEALRFVLPARKSKGKKKARRIYLSPVALEIARRLVGRHPVGEIFLNTQNRPWTPYSISCRFSRLEKHVGKKFCLYGARHSFCQRMLERGINHIVVAELMGHADATMVAKQYQHMNSADDHLRKAIGG